MIVSVADRHREAVIKACPRRGKTVLSLEALSKPFNLPEITDEPPSLMTPDKYCMLECGHWEFTDQPMSMIEDRLNEAMDPILRYLEIQAE